MAKPGPSERQPKESAAAFEAFRIYLEHGPARSTAKVGRQLGKSKTLMDRWSGRWEWQRRVREFEAEAIADLDVETAEAIRQTARRQAETARLHVEATSLVAEEIARRRAEKEPTEKELKKLSLAELLQLEPTHARAHNRGVITQRLALGMTTDQPGEALPQTEAREQAARLSDDELDSSLLGVDELAAKRAQKAKGGGKKKAAK